MEFYTFVDIPPQLFNDKLQIILGIDYVYTDNTGNVVKKENIGKEENKIQDSVKTVHLILEKGNQLYNADQVSYHDINEENCSLQTMRDKLIAALEGSVPIITNSSMYFEANSFDNDNESDSEDDNEQDEMKTSQLPDTSAQSSPRFMDTTTLNLDKHPLPKKTDFPSSDTYTAAFAKKYNNRKTDGAGKILLGNLSKQKHEAVIRMFSNVEPTKGGLDNKSIIQSHLNASSRPTSALSQQSDSELRKNNFEIGRRALIYVNSVYKIGILGPPRSNSNEYIIDATTGTSRVQITEDMFEDRVPKDFKNRDSYAQLDHSAYKQPKDIFLLRKNILINLKSAQRGGKKTKKVHPAKKNITRSKRR